MDDFKSFWLSDIERWPYKNKWAVKFSYFHRKSQLCTNPLLKSYYRLRFRQMRRKNGIEMSYSTVVGKGFKLHHPYNITINTKATIGENVTIFKGVTIGQEWRGPRLGAPTIGNNVWIGPNASIVGKINIGNDVLIAPNSYVNCDIPDHSVVLGNPCIIKDKANATEGYI